MPTMESVQLILLVLVLFAALGMPLLVYVQLYKRQREQSEKFIARMEESLGASVKLLEVRNYYEQMAGEFKKMLDEAYKEGNRFRQDHLRRLVERLEQLKARTLDRTTKLLEPEGGRPPRRRNRRRRPSGNPNRPQGPAQPQKPPQGPTQPPKPTA